MFGHFEPVNHCCFSPEDAFVSTSSNDGTIKVTDLLLSVNLIHTPITSPVTPCSVFFFLSMQLFQVSSANEWKTISVREQLAENDEEVMVKCSTWTADGKRIICAARNAVLVSVFRRNGAAEGG